MTTPALNSVFLIGRLIRDPEIRYTSKGTAFTTIGLAINEFYEKEQQQKVEKTTFVNVKAWGRLAEHIGQRFRKGTQVVVTGALRTDHWDDKQTGEKRSAMNVVAESIEVT